MEITLGILPEKSSSFTNIISRFFVFYYTENMYLVS